MNPRFATPPREPSMQDRLQSEAVDAAVAMATEQFKRTVQANPDRKVRELKKVEVRNICIGAISGWALKRAEQRRERPELADTLELVIAGDLTPAVEI